MLFLTRRRKKRRKERDCQTWQGIVIGTSERDEICDGKKKRERREKEEERRKRGRRSRLFFSGRIQQQSLSLLIQVKPWKKCLPDKNEKMGSKTKRRKKEGRKEVLKRRISVELERKRERWQEKPQWKEWMRLLKKKKEKIHFICRCIYTSKTKGKVHCLSFSNIFMNESSVLLLVSLSVRLSRNPAND